MINWCAWLACRCCRQYMYSAWLYFSLFDSLIFMQMTFCTNDVRPSTSVSPLPTHAISSPYQATPPLSFSSPARSLQPEPEVEVHQSHPSPQFFRSDRSARCARAHPSPPLLWLPGAWQLVGLTNTPQTRPVANGRGARGAVHPR